MVTPVMPVLNSTKVTTSPNRPTRAALAGVDQLIIMIPKRCPASVWRQLPEGGRLKKLLSRRVTADRSPVATQLGNKRLTGIVLDRVDPDATTFDKSTAIRKLVAAALGRSPGKAAVLAAGFDDAAADELASLAVESLLINGFRLPDFKSESPKARTLRQIVVFNSGSAFDVAATLARARGNNLARWLGALPPNVLTAAAYRSAAEELAEARGWSTTFFGTEELSELGAGAFLAVARGNEDASAGILRLSYEPAGEKSSGRIALVGKGIIFDTGGNNLKPFRSMLDMHLDMQGSAVALAALDALSGLEAGMRIDCWLALTENRIGPAAYKSQDLITALNGKTIQAIHTDAEGRMVLADTLALAAREEPDLIIDFATLTGACVNAVTNRYSGAFTNRPDLHAMLIGAGERSGERVWPFPVTAEFTRDLESDNADLVQCRVEGEGDHIHAACFLNEFVPAGIPWVHVDLSACTRKGGLGLVGSEVTGFGVRLALELVRGDGAILDAA